jgi:hypothetical protein
MPIKPSMGQKMPPRSSTMHDGVYMNNTSTGINAAHILIGLSLKQAQSNASLRVSAFRPIGQTSDGAKKCRGKYTGLPDQLRCPVKPVCEPYGSQLARGAPLDPHGILQTPKNRTSAESIMCASQTGDWNAHLKTEPHLPPVLKSSLFKTSTHSCRRQS